ncbi:MAG: TauD/TfdA family dioxygenase [Pirellulales bacterium]|nr:TauD/TfdA family dioxygenase [Pirellulales bacterium]
MLTDSPASLTELAVLKTFGSSPLPLIIEAKPAQADVSREELLAWLKEHRSQLDRLLHKHGALLFRNFKCLQGADDFEAVIKATSHTMLDYAGGTTPRSAISGKIVSSTDAPSHLTIGLHQEMSYLEPSPNFPDPTPDKVAFFCEIEPAAGGQTPLCDMRIVLQKLPQDLIDRFESKGLRLTRQLPETKAAGYEVTWPTVFGTADRSEAEAFAAKRGWRIEWTDDGGVRVFQQPSPSTRCHRVTGEKIWFNQAHLLHTAFAPWTGDFLGPSPEEKAEADRLRPAMSTRFFYQSTHADGSELLVSDLEIIRKTIADTMTMFDWKAGDLLICDNKLVAHGRQPYTPPRKILAALAADDRQADH